MNENFAKLNAIEAADRIAAGKLTCEALARSCLDRVEMRDSAIQAWRYYDPDGIIAAAKEIDARTKRGPLHGLPIGVKDVIDTADMPTECGSPIYAGRRPREDAQCVALARNAGALIFGKTVTTEFADWKAGPTRNPLDIERTPGGSSSGSAAAVADDMVPLAFGTQTGGSVNRPASFCGIVGFKPSYGLHPMTGIRSLSPAMDTLGFFGRRVADVALFAAALCGNVYDLSRFNRAPLSIGVWRMNEAGRVDQAAWDAVAKAIEDATRAGARIQELAFPREFERIIELQVALYKYEMARAMQPEWLSHRDRLSAEMQRAVDEGLRIPDARAQQCRADLKELRRLFLITTADVEVVMTPAATGEALKGLSDTGDPFFSKPPTVLYGPSISIPCSRGPSGLPVGIQLASSQGKDQTVLAAATWLENAIERSWE